MDSPIRSDFASLVAFSTEMSLHWRPLTPAHLSDVAPLWNDRQTYTPADFAATMDLVSRLVRQGRAFGAVVFRADRLCAFGISTFVPRHAVDELLARPVAQFGKGALARTMKGEDAILTRHDIAAGNAGRGLDAFVLNSNYAPDIDDVPLVVGCLIEAFVAVHRGYRLARVVNEVHGPAVTIAAAARSFCVHALHEDVGGIPGLRGILASISREQAIANSDSLLPMFVYSPPVVRFCPAEQRLLELAITGAPDPVLAQQLGVPVSAVKARWLRLRTRAFQRIPGLFSQVRTNERPDRRGAQHRHLILEYVRQHPSELMPYPPPRVTR